LTGANFTGTDLRDISYASPDSTNITTNTILPGGTIQGLNLNATNPTLFVRNYNYAYYTPIHVQQGMTLTQSASLVLEFDGNPWGSTISFDSGIPVTLGGNLALDLVAGVNPAGLVGDSVQLFNWTGVDPSGQFASITNGLPPGYSWNTSQLYTTGDVTLVPTTGTFAVWASAGSGSWSNSGNWTSGVPNAVGAWAVFNASTTAAMTITLDSPQTVGNLVLGNSGSTSVGYTLMGSGSNSLTLNNSGSGATITVTDGSHVIDAPVILADNLLVSGGGTLAFGNSSSITGSYALTMSGTGGTLILSGTDTYTGGTNVTAGKLIVTTNTALPDGASLSVGAGGTLIFDPSAAGAPVASTISPVPEPGTLALLAVALCGVAAYQRVRYMTRSNPMRRSSGFRSIIRSQVF
jgi:autotransporter-associated beta strand protein